MAGIPWLDGETWLAQFCELGYVAVPKYCSRFGIGRLELIDDLLGEAPSGTT